MHGTALDHAERRAHFCPLSWLRPRTRSSARQAGALWAGIGAENNRYLRWRRAAWPGNGRDHDGLARRATTTLGTVCRQGGCSIRAIHRTRPGAEPGLHAAMLFKLVGLRCPVVSHGARRVHTLVQYPLRYHAGFPVERVL